MNTNAIDVITPDQITGLILAGGRGSRMGGVDKGLQNHRGMPMALQVLMRLQLQLDRVMINANRNLAAYESMGVPVWPDAMADYPGPLAGILAGLEHCETPYLLTVPCDTPNFPLDLVERMASSMTEHGADIAVAATPPLQLQPVFCLMRSSLIESLVAFLHAGERKIDRWTALHRCTHIVFDDAEAFANANTPDELRRLQT